MTNDSLGISFAPTRDAAADGPARGGLEGVPQALKVLSLRLPRILGARSPIPNPLAQAPGAGGAPGGVDPYMSAVIQTLLRTLGQSGQAMPGLPGLDGMSPPTPNFTPGIDTNPNPFPRPPSPPQELPMPAPELPPPMRPRQRTGWGDRGPESMPGMDYRNR